MFELYGWVATVAPVEICTPSSLPGNLAEKGFEIAQYYPDYIEICGRNDAKARVPDKVLCSR